MRAGADVSVTEKDGWLVVRIRGYVSPERVGRWVELYADGDGSAACSARKLEYRDVSDFRIARADPAYGARMKH